MKNFTLDELRQSIPAQISDNPIKFMLPMWYGSNGSKGGYLFTDSVEALKFKEIEIRRAENNLKWEEARNKQIREANEKELAIINSYGSFLSENPMKRGKQRKTLETLIRATEGVMTRKELIELRVNSGWQLKQDKKAIYNKRGMFIGYDETKMEWELEKDGTYILLNGTERDYAEYLINKKN
jgi:hypothetical protein